MNSVDLASWLSTERSPLQRQPKFNGLPRILSGYFGEFGPPLSEFTEADEREMDLDAMRNSTYQGREVSREGDVFYDAKALGRARKRRTRRKHSRRRRRRSMKRKHPKSKNRKPRKKSTRKERK